MIRRNKFGVWVPRGDPPAGGPRHYHERGLARIDPTLDVSARGLMRWSDVFRARRFDGAARRFFAEMEPYAPPAATAMAWLPEGWLPSGAPTCLLAVGGDARAVERDLPTLAALAARLARER